MNKTHRHGMTIMLVIGFLAIIGGSFVLLTTATGSMASDTSKAAAGAATRNLQASAAAWWRHSHASLDSAKLAEGIDLDVGQLHVTDGKLHLQATPQAAAKGDCTLTWQCRAGSVKVKASREITP